MREIKFRFWDARSKKMRFDLGLMPYQLQKEYHSIQQLEKGYYTDPNSQELFTTMQSTGLLDKNGVEIYEGDILKAWIINQKDDKGNPLEPTFIKHTVEYIPSYCCFSLSVYIIQNNLNKTNSKPDDFQLEVVGNIYENL